MPGRSDRCRASGGHPPYACVQAPFFVPEVCMAPSKESCSLCNVAMSSLSMFSPPPQERREDGPQ
eukprot:10016567-Lingulodinium_polyedra.AAC.1